MGNSIFIAKLIGPLFLAVAVGLFVNATIYRAMAEEFMRSHALIYLSGLLTLTAGLALVLTHNVWVADWRVVITVLGWLAVVGGVLRIIFPQKSQEIGRWFLQHPHAFTIGGAVWLAVALLLCFFGYFR